MDMVDAALVTLQEQAKTPQNQVMTATRPTVSQTAERLNGPVYKALVAAGLAGLAMVLALCLVVDRLELFLSSRAARTQARTTAALVAAAKERSRAARIARERARAAATVPADDPVDEEAVVDDPPGDAPEDGVGGEVAEDPAAPPPELAAPAPVRRRRTRNARRRPDAGLAGGRGDDTVDSPEQLAG
jgi:hypothetical protein